MTKDVIGSSNKVVGDHIMTDCKDRGLMQGIRGIGISAAPEIGIEFCQQL